MFGSKKAEEQIKASLEALVQKIEEVEATLLDIKVDTDIIAAKYKRNVLDKKGVNKMENIIQGIIDFMGNPIGATIGGVIIAFLGVNILDPIYQLVDNIILNVDKFIFNNIPIPPVRAWCEDKLIARLDKRIKRNQDLKQAIKK